MTKKINLTAKPVKSADIDKWVSAASTEQPKPVGKMRRLTVDLEDDLHRRLRIYSTTVGIPHADMIREHVEYLVKNEPH